VGYTYDKQIKQLREQTAGTGVDVTPVDGGKAILVNLPNGVTFDTDSTIIKPGFRDTLDKVASFQPHVILLDVMMPKLSGFEVCERLKSDPATSPIMILMVTALGELGDIERAVEAGTDDFLSKPVNKVELVKRVENMLKLRHVSDELERLRSYISTMDDELPPRASGHGK
jgi:CheY-like chemotaxis protein